MADIKDTMEVLEGLKAIAEVGADIFEDGKISFSDLSKLNALVQSFDTLKNAIEGIKNIDDEMKDLDLNEITTIITKVYEIVKVFKKDEVVTETIVDTTTV